MCTDESKLSSLEDRLEHARQAQRDLIATFPRRYGAIKRELASGVAGPAVMPDLRQFGVDFFDAWMNSSRVVINALGKRQTMDILDLLSTRRGSTWQAEDYQLLLRLPERVTIYRGGAGTLDEVLKGFSWTLDRFVADQFADAHDHGTVLQAEIHRNDIVLISFLEQEIVPRQGAPKNIQVVPRSTSLNRDGGETD